MSRVKSFRFSDSPEAQAFGDRLLNALQPIKEGEAMKSEITLVLAGNYRQFEQWMKNRELSPQDRRYAYVSDVNKLRGFRGAKLFRTGTAYVRKDYGEILEMALANGIEVVE